MHNLCLMNRALTAMAIATGMLLAPFGCRRDPPPPTPRLVGTPGPTNAVPAPEDQLGIGGSGAEGGPLDEGVDAPTHAD